MRQKSSIWATYPVSLLAEETLGLEQHLLIGRVFGHAAGEVGRIGVDLGTALFSMYFHVKLLWGAAVLFPVGVDVPWRPLNTPFKKSRMTQRWGTEVW